MKQGYHLVLYVVLFFVLVMLLAVVVPSLTLSGL